MIIVLIWYRYWSGVAIHSAVLLLNAVAVLSIYSGSSHYKPDTSTAIRLCSINLLSSNSSYDLVSTYINQTAPDILILIEYTDQWSGDLDASLNAFPYHHKAQQNDNYGMAVFSKIELIEAKTVFFIPEGPPSINFEVNIDGNNTRILATHPRAPVSTQDFQERNRQLDKIGSISAGFRYPFIVIGDMNCTPYSPNFVLLSPGKRLVDTRKGSGILPSWPTYFAPLKIPIDHCLVSKHFVVTKRSTGSYIGSDHLPLEVELSFRY